MGAAKSTSLLYKGVKVIGGKSVVVCVGVGGGSMWLHWMYKDISGTPSSPTGSSVDHLTALLRLARSPDSDIRFFGSHNVNQSHVEVEQDLRTLVSHLPLTDASKYLEYLTFYALNTEEVMKQKGDKWCFGRADFCDDAVVTPPEDQVLMYCMEALCLHSALTFRQTEERCHDIVRLGGLQLMRRVAQLYPDITSHATFDLGRTKSDPNQTRSDGDRSKHNLTHVILIRLLLTLLGNICVWSDLHEHVLKSGWIDTLARYMRSDDTVISLLSARALSNLDATPVQPTNHHTFPARHKRLAFKRFVYKDGVYIMHPIYSTTEPVVADVVFVHGLLGGPFKTWRQHDQVKESGDYLAHRTGYTQCWPKDWLCEDCPNLRVISVQYDTHLTTWHHSSQHSQGNLTTRSSELVNKLRHAGVGSRPVIWVGHSMGGLLIKDMLTHDPDMAAMTRGIVFYSVPHHGSKVAQITKQISFLSFPSVEVQELSQDSAYLQQLHSEFTECITQHHIPCLSFVESLKTTLKMKLKMLVVPRESADIGNGELTVLHSDHVNVCKPFSRQSLSYTKTLAFIMRCIHQQQQEQQPDDIDDSEDFVSDASSDLYAAFDVF